MSIAVDTNILLHCVNNKSPYHDKANGFLHGLLAEGTPWCLTWGTIYEFLRVSTHRRAFPEPLTWQQATRFLDVLLDREEVSVLTPTGQHWTTLNRTLTEVSPPAGNLFHDISTAVILREHGIREIATADADFLQFRFLKVVNPLLNSA